MIADVLIEMAWKSSLVAAVVLLAMLTMRRNSPSDRVAVADLGFTLLVLIPVEGSGFCGSGALACRRRCCSPPPAHGCRWRC